MTQSSPYTGRGSEDTESSSTDRKDKIIARPRELKGQLARPKMSPNKSRSGCKK
jgi:hypothetical protein